MGELVVNLTLLNPEKHQIKILSDFPGLNNLQLSPGQHVIVRAVIPPGMQFYNRVIRDGDKAVGAYVGFVDADWAEN